MGGWCYLCVVVRGRVVIAAAAAMFFAVFFGGGHEDKFHNLLYISVKERDED